MSHLLVKGIQRRNPFSLVSLPLLGRVWRYPSEKWTSPDKNILFGAPFKLFFALFRKAIPIKSLGTFELKLQSGARQIRFDARNSQYCALYETHFACGYETEVGALLDLLVPDDGVFVDVGSNWGYFPLYLSSRPGFRGLIHAFEPFPSTYADLCSVIEQAQLNTLIKAHQMALSDRIGHASMRLPDFTSTGLATVEHDEKGNQRGAIPTGRLDDIRTETLSAIKVDVEGMESAVLRGGLQLLAQHRPFVIFENTRAFDDPARTLEPFRILEKLGYEFFQPGWLERDDFAIGGDFWAQESPKEPFGLNKLVLAPLSPADRFLRQPHMNVLACHQSRRDLLLSQFADTAV
jgi:FkbM family methyltransferase